MKKNRIEHFVSDHVIIPLMPLWTFSHADLNNIFFFRFFSFHFCTFGYYPHLVYSYALSRSHNAFHLPINLDDICICMKYSYFNGYYLQKKPVHGTQYWMLIMHFNRFPLPSYAQRVDGLQNKKKRDKTRASVSNTIPIQ